MVAAAEVTVVPPAVQAVGIVSKSIVVNVPGRYPEALTVTVVPAAPSDGVMLNAGAVMVNEAVLELAGLAASETVTVYAPPARVLGTVNVTVAGTAPAVEVVAPAVVPVYSCMYVGVAVLNASERVLEAANPLPVRVTTVKTGAPDNDAPAAVVSFIAGATVTVDV